MTDKLQEARDALDKAQKFFAEIEGHGYGGTSEYEDVRAGLKTIQTAFDAYDKLAGDNGWMPIDENTPRDGTKIRLLDQNGDITVGWFDLPIETIKDAFTTTHWKPLNPPKGNDHE